jgi:ABC-type phosphate/phosphonate transport system substrate-binding protein
MIVNARMYSATPEAKQAWRDILGWVLERAALDWQLVDYDPPAPLGALWGRQDLGCVMMCGLPYSRRQPRPTLVAAPLPSPARYGGRPIYFTDLVVRADSRHRRLEDTFGGVLGYTLKDSMSGYVALRAHLARHGTGLYRAAVGGLLNARQVIEALDERRIDIGPLDSYYHDLLRRNAPTFAAKVRVVDTTAAAPIPPLVATAALREPDLARLQRALHDVADAGELAAARDVLLLQGFAVPRAEDYAPLAAADVSSDPWPSKEL